MRAPRVNPAMVALYVALIAATVAGVVALIDRGAREHAQPGIAGGYSLSGFDRCIGPAGTFDVQQSGEFVALSNAAGTLGGQLRFRGAALTGTVDCVGSGSLRFDGVVRAGPRC
jgi:hypothetical protein